MRTYYLIELEKAKAVAEYIQSILRTVTDSELLQQLSNDRANKLTSVEFFSNKLKECDNE
jgi:hypothetical protein